MENGTPGPTGIPVDSAGGPTIDPTKNVLDLVGASVTRLDDLRVAESRRVDERISLIEKHTKEIGDLRARHNQDLREAEAKRIDAIRVIDIQAVQTANDKATAQAQVLASQVGTSAETLRTLVVSTAAATAAQLTQIITPITDRIALLEKTQYEGVGKERVTDPMMIELVNEMKKTRSTLSTGSGRSTGFNQGWLLASGIVAFAIMVVGFLAFRQ